MYCPGALPVAFSRSSAPSSTSACLALFSGMVTRRAAKRLHRGKHIVIAAQTQRESCSNCFTRQIVFSGAKTAGKDDHIGTSNGNLRRIGQVGQIVAD